MQRREFLLGAAAAAAWALSDDWRRWALNRESVGQLAARTQALGERLHREPAGTVLPEIRGHLAHIRGLIKDARVGTALRVRLYRVGGQTAGLAGWIAWLVGQQTEAETYYAEARTMADETGDPEEHALLLTARAAMHSGVPSGGQDGNPARALELLAAAEAATAGDTSPHLRAWIAASQAQEHALLGDGLAMHRCLERAANLLPGRPGPGFFSDWDDALLTSYVGTSYTLAGESREGIAVLEPLLQSVRMPETQWAVATEADLAAAYAATGEHDQAAEILAQALGHALTMNLTVDAQRVAGYRRRLLPPSGQATPALRRLDDQLRQSRLRP
jgi:tetratricopeptide (TPR) repeat protein